jgi:hypothetical protein
MNEKLSQFIKETKVQIAQSEKFKIYDAETLPQMTKNFSLHELNQLKILILTWNLAGSVRFLKVLRFNWKKNVK